MLCKLLQSTAATWSICVGITKCGSLGLWWTHTNGTAVQPVQNSISWTLLSETKTKKTYVYKTIPGPIHRLCGELTCIDGSSSLSDWAIWSPRFSHCGGHSSIFSLGFLNACLWNMLCCGWTECGRCTGAIFYLCALLDGDETSSQRVLAVAFTVEILGNYTPPISLITIWRLWVSLVIPLVCR